MSWQPDIDELNRRTAMSHQMGGADSIAFHKGRGKLTVRERIDILADQGSFRETGALAGRPEWNGNELANLTPANSVTGVVTIDGRKTIIHGGDFTIRGGAADGSVGDKMGWAIKQAYMRRLPFVRLLDATGGSVRTFEVMGRTYLSSNDRTAEVELMQMVPVVSMVLGSVAGLPAVQAAMCHFNVMVKGTTQVFVAGPSVVKASQGIEITKEELWQTKTCRSTNPVSSPTSPTMKRMRSAQVRRFLSYLPTNVWEMPPRVQGEDDPARREEQLVSLVPRNTRRVYDVHKLLDLVMDRGSFFEIQPHFGRSRLTGLARVDGYPVA